MQLRSRENEERIKNILLTVQENVQNKITKIKLCRRLLTHWCCGKPMVKVKTWQPSALQCAHQADVKMITGKLAFCACVSCKRAKELGYSPSWVG